MVKNSLSLILVVMSYVLPLTTLNLMVYFEFLILLPICYLSINFVCKTMFFCYFGAYRFYIQDLPTWKILYKCLTKDGIYPLPALSSLHSSNSTAYSTSQDHQSLQAFVNFAQISLWHNRLGHASVKLLHSAIQSVNHAFTFNKIYECCSSCKSCISAKMHRLPLSKHEI